MKLKMKPEFLIRTKKEILEEAKFTNSDILNIVEDIEKLINLNISARNGDEKAIDTVIKLASKDNVDITKSEEEKKEDETIQDKKEKTLDPMELLNKDGGISTDDGNSGLDEPMSKLSGELE